MSGRASKSSFHHEYHDLYACHFNPMAEEINDDESTTLSIIRFDFFLTIKKL